MKRLLFVCVAAFGLLVTLAAQESEVHLKMLGTSDIHGNFYPYNFITQQPWNGSLSRVYTHIQQQRAVYGDNLLLLDNGDILQGQPSVYYYNYIDSTSNHLCASIMNYMKYDAGNMGNHDVEVGYRVFNRWIDACKFPILCANMVDAVTGVPPLKPYEVFVRDGVKVVVFALITPAIPVWLSENLWKGLRFDDMEQTARKWMPIILEKEKPDVVIGMFHSGAEAQWLSKYRENASVEVARKVPGFDVVLMGHDHIAHCSKIANVAGDSVLVINPANAGRLVADVDITLQLLDGKVQGKQTNGTLVPMTHVEPDEAWMKEFATQYDTIQRFVKTKIGTFTEEISTRPSYFGSSAFVDFIHSIQLDISGADISLVAPLFFDASIPKGDVTVGDMFSLYQYENMLYVMTLTGKEIKGLLEESYYMWTNRMKSANDHLLWLKKTEKPGGTNSGARYSFQNYSFNFDSAAGIIYTVDVRKPKGQKVNIISLANGDPFHLNKTYKVALNSYRGNGGGELLTKGARIPQDKLKDRIVYSSDRDLRYYLIKYVTKKGVLTPHALNQWRFIPEEWTVPAGKRDYQLLFGE